MIPAEHTPDGPGWWQNGAYRRRCVCGVTVAASDREFTQRRFDAHVAEAEGEITTEVSG